MSLTESIRQRTVEDLLPAPQSVEACSSDFPLDASTVIAFSSGQAEFAAQRLVEMIRAEHNLALKVRRIGAPGLAVWLTDGEGSPPSAIGLPSEAYRLDADSRSVRIGAGDEAGLLWGAMTLRQLIVRQSGQLWVRGARIEDQPRYRWRGFMIDSGRAPNSLPKLQRIIRICSALKLNFVIFREGDDELNAVRYQTNRLGSANPCALTIEQVREFVRYARRHGITVIPEIESLGHSQAKRRHYPDLVTSGRPQHYEGIGEHIRKAHLLPEDPRSYDLLESVYREWLGVLDHGMLHLGLDEVPLPADQQARHFRGLLERIETVEQNLGRRITPLVWADAPPTPPGLADRVIRCLWSYPEHAEFGPISQTNEHLRRQGIESLTRLGSTETAWMGGGSGSSHQPYSKCPYDQAFDNLRQWADFARPYPNLTGLCAVQWGGNMLDEWLPDFAAAADVSWNPNRQRESFDERMARIRRMFAALPDAADPHPETIDPPAWDGIWLKHGRWHQDIMSQATSG